MQYARVAAQFEALLFRPLLAPLDAALGETGCMITGPLAQSLAERDGVFSKVLSHMLERSHD